MAIENFYKDVIVNPDYDKHSASSRYNDDPIGIAHGRGRLNSIQAWSPANKNSDQWYQIDLSSEQRIIGIVTQGRTGGTQYIKTYKVKVSIDGNTWTDVDNGRIFKGNNEKTEENPDFEVKTKFNTPINSRYVRVYPVAYKGWPSMRIGVIIGESKFKNISPTTDTYKKIIINSDKFTTQLDIKENNNFNFNMYLDLYEKIESDTLMCPPPEIVDEVKYSDNIYKYEGDKELPDYLYMKQKTKNLKNSAKFVSDISTISSIESLKNDYDKNIVKYGIKNNDNKKRELINNSNARNVDTILNTEIDEETQTNASIDNCLNHHKLINISINDTFELQLSIYIEGEERTLATPSVSINNIIQEDNNNIVVSIDENKFLNVYLNNILVIDANISNILHENSKNYYFKNIILNNSDKINNVYCWKHETLKDCAIWNTKTIKINSENGIKCMSNKNKNIYLDFVLEYYSKGIYHIKDNNNNYLCISNEAGNYLIIILI